MSTFGSSESHRRGVLETTRWEDVHGQHGTEGYEYVKAIAAERRALQKENWTLGHHDDDKTGCREKKGGAVPADEDDEGFDSEEDLAILRKFRSQRIAEMKAQRATEKYGTVRQINRAEYVAEVAEASKSCWVVVHLYQDHVADCTLMARALTRLAARKRATKFLKMKATDCIQNFPDRLCPCLLVYRDGQKQKQFEGLGRFGGRKVTADDLEWHLAQAGACSTEMEGNPRVERVITDALESALQQDLDA